VKLQVEWDRLLVLKEDTNMIYSLNLTKLPQSAGVYVFGRRWGNGFEVLYVGKANRVQNRVKGQLNNLRLMQHLKNAKAGKRVLLAGLINTKPGQQTANA
jgi:hypothetical protein